MAPKILWYRLMFIFSSQLLMNKEKEERVIGQHRCCATGQYRCVQRSWSSDAAPTDFLISLDILLISSLFCCKPHSTQPLVFSRQSVSSLPKHWYLKVIFLFHCFVVSLCCVTQMMMTKSCVILTVVIRKQKKTQWQWKRALPARATAIEHAPGVGQTEQLLGYKPVKRPRWHLDVNRIPLSSFHRA